MREIDPHMPINITAARVVSKHKEPQVKARSSTSITSMVRLPTIMYRGNPKHNLSGLKIGRVEVLGVYAIMPHKKNGSNSGARWVVRCSCGRYEVKSTKHLKRGMSFGDKSNTSCSECGYKEYLRKSSKLEI